MPTDRDSRSRDDISQLEDLSPVADEADGVRGGMTVGTGTQTYSPGTSTTGGMGGSGSTGTGTGSGGSGSTSAPTTRGGTNPFGSLQ